MYCATYTRVTRYIKINCSFIGCDNVLTILRRVRPKRRAFFIVKFPQKILKRKKTGIIISTNEKKYYCI